MVLAVPSRPADISSRRGPVRASPEGPLNPDEYTL